MNYSIRPATVADLPAINDIYNYYVVHSTCTYQDQPETAASRERWFAAHGEKHPVVVAVEDAQVIGWGSLSPFHARSAYRHTVENAVYVRHDCHRRGVGQLILADLIDRARQIGHHSIIALISAEQTASIKLHERNGFTQAGKLHEAGQKFGRWLDVVYLQRMLRD